MFSHLRTIAAYLPTLVRMLTGGCERIDKISEELVDVRREFGDLVKELQDVKDEVIKLREILPQPPQV